MKPYKPGNGLRFMTRPDGSKFCLGARTGQDYELPDDPAAPVKLQLQRLPLDSQGYDAGGAYWGIGQPLYVAHENGEARLFVRGATREAAKAVVRKRIPGARFHR